MQCKLSENTVL